MRKFIAGHKRFWRNNKLLWRNKSLDFDTFYAITQGDNDVVVCKDVHQIWKTGMFSKRLLYKFLGGRPITETTGIILVCFDGKYTWAYEKILKIKKVC